MSEQAVAELCHCGKEKGHVGRHKGSKNLLAIYDSTHGTSEHASMAGSALKRPNVPHKKIDMKGDWVDYTLMPPTLRIRKDILKSFFPRYFQQVFGGVSRSAIKASFSDAMKQTIDDYWPRFRMSPMRRAFMRQGGVCDWGAWANRPIEHALRWADLIETIEYDRELKDEAKK